MKKIFPLLIFIASFSLWACSPALSPVDPSNADPLPPLKGEWTIKMTHSGGIAGIMRSIEIHSNSSYIVEDRNASTTEQGILSGEQFFALTETYKAIQYAPPSEPDSMVCADCFVYEIEIVTDTETFALELSDITLSDSGFAGFVGLLREIMDQ